jgi:hypothetical protein
VLGQPVTVVGLDRVAAPRARQLSH